jgi:alkylation response protein AidB-like acyl-CoA dehydrogenase
LRSAGVDVRPIRNATGEAHFCEIFLTDVRIPPGNLIGPENDGWRVAQSTLNSERGGTMVELAERLGNGYRWLIDLARATLDPQGRPYSQDALVRDRIAHLGSQLRSLRLMCAQITDDSAGANGIDAGVLASIIKLYYSELLQDLTGYGLELAGIEAQLETGRPLSAGWESGHWLLDYIGSWEWTIPGGTSEIQRNIIGERGLGLPREPVTS